MSIMQVSLYNEDFVGTMFYCLRALTDGNWDFQTREKTLEFSAAV